MRGAPAPRIAWQAGDPRLQAAIEAALAGPAGPGGPARSNPRRTLEIRTLALAPPLAVVLKTHHVATGRHRLRERIKRALGRSPARREWAAMVALHAAGLPVPRPLAWGRAPSGDELVVSEAVAGVPLAEAFALSDPAGREGIVDRLAEALVALARQGRIHGDLHLGNLMHETASGRVVLLDHQRGRRARGADDRLRDLARLELSLLRADWSPPLRARLRARIGVGPELDDALRRFAADHVRGRARRVLRPGRRIEPVARAGLRGRRDARLPESTLFSLITRATESAARRPRRGGRAFVAEVVLDGRRHCVKWSEAGSLARRLGAALRGSRAARAFDAGQREALLLGRAARPLAALDASAGLLPGASWLVLEWIDGVDLDEHRPASPAAATALAHALADWLADLHALGVSHADLKGSNLRLETRAEPGPGTDARADDPADASEGAFRFRLLDLEDLVGPGRLDDESRLKALAQLNASIADDRLPLAARDAFLERYAKRLPFRDPRLDWPTARREIARRSLARRHRFRGEGCGCSGPGESASDADGARGFSPPSP